MIGTTIDQICVSARNCLSSAQRLSLPVLSGGLLFAFLVMSITGAHAAPINYGNFSGVPVDFVGVTEDANSVGDAPPLFGPPTVAGDALDFDPVGFNAAAAGAAGVDITDGQLLFRIVAHDGFTVENVVLNEAGDTTLAGFGTDASFTAVRGNVVVNIYEVDGVGINVVSEQFVMSFTPSGGDFGLLTDGGGGPLFNASWSGGVPINLDSILTAHGVPFVFGATEVSINLDNTLIALSENGTSTLIAKKNFGGLSITVNIPEPASLIMLAIAGLGLVFVRPVR
jgi:hypothetical protein